MSEPYYADYTGPELDSAVGEVLNNKQDTIADALAMTKAEMAKAKVVFVLGGAVLGDGGGGIFRYSSSMTDATDDIAHLRPVDYAVNGPGGLVRFL